MTQEEKSSSAFCASQVFHWVMVGSFQLRGLLHFYMDDIEIFWGSQQLPNNGERKSIFCMNPLYTHIAEIIFFLSSSFHFGCAACSPLSEQQNSACIFIYISVYISPVSWGVFGKQTSHLWIKEATVAVPVWWLLSFRGYCSCFFHRFLKTSPWFDTLTLLT